MASVLSSIGVAIGESVISPILKWSANRIPECLQHRVKMEGILVPFLKTSLKNNLVSDRTLIVDLDFEIQQGMDEDDLKLSTECNLYTIRLYNNAKKIVAELAEMNEISKKLDNILFVSADYKLLKFCGCNESGIDYFIPSDTLHEELKSASNWDEFKYQKIKDMLLKNKSSKLIVYNSLAELLNKVIDIYPDCKVKV